MTGSLQIKRGKYCLVVNCYVDGKRKQRWFATDLPQKGNKKRAEQMLRDKIQELEAEEAAAESIYSGNDQLFSAAIDDWLKDAGKHVDPVTLQGYETLVRTQIRPYFSELGLRVSEITLEVLQTYFDEKHRHGRLDGKGGLSPRTLRLHKNILHQTLNAAVISGVIPKNPCDFVSLPSNERFEAHYYNMPQVNRLLSLIHDEPLYPLIRFTAVYGVRRSEVLGLQWDCVDFENSTISITRTVVKVTTIVEKNRTKNESSRRSFPMTDDIRKMLLELQDRQTEMRNLFGAEYHENNYVFKWDDGHPFSPDYVSQRFSRILEIHDLPHIRFHELRHSSASNLLNMGFTLKDVQEWLGHADIKVTANIYGHLDVRRKQSMADALGAGITAG